jgi:hypothetical protein
MRREESSLVNIILAASHDIHKESQDERLLEDQQGYRDQGLMPSVKFARVEGVEPHENKFLMPVYGNLSSLAMLLIQTAVRGHRVAIVGSEEVLLYAQRIKEYLVNVHPWKEGNRPSTLEENIILALEAKEPRMSESFRIGSEALGHPEKYAFITGDLVTPDLDSFEKDYAWFNPRRYILGLDLNARQRIFKNGIELFTRNYYSKFLELSGPGALFRRFLARLREKKQDGIRLRDTERPSIEPGSYEFKEGNIYLLSGEFDKWPVIDIVAKLRTKGGTGSPEVLRDIAEEMYGTRSLGVFLRSAEGPRAFFDAAFALGSFELSKGFKWLGIVRYKTMYTTIGGVRRIANTLFGKPVYVSIDHEDPFRLKDIDAFHDLQYYRTILAPFERGEERLEDIFDEETASAIRGANEYLAAQPEEFKQRLPLVYKFDEWFENRSRTLGIREYFTPEGKFSPRTASDEKITESIDYLKERHKLRQAA